MTRRELTIKLIYELAAKITKLETYGLIKLASLDSYNAQTVFDRAVAIRDIIYTQILHEKSEFKTTDQLQKWFVDQMERYKLDVATWLATLEPFDVRDVKSNTCNLCCQHCWSRIRQLDNYCFTCSQVLQITTTPQVAE